MEPIGQFREVISNLQSKPQVEEIGHYKLEPELAQIRNKKRFMYYADYEVNGKFIIDENNKKIIGDIWDYFFNENNSKLDTNKGLLLIGGVGVGKSMIMKVFSKLTSGTHKYFNLESAINIQSEALNNYSGTVRKYSSNPYINEFGDESTNPRPFCFDDLGCENQTIQFYGNVSSPISTILQLRYDLFQNSSIRLKTYATTNLDSNALKEFYKDERLISRFREMFNLIHLDGEDRRK